MDQLEEHTSMRLINFLPLITGFLVSLFLTPFVIRVTRRKGIVDVPDNSALKIHLDPIPNTGGIVVFTGAASTLLLYSFFIYPAGTEMYGLLSGCFFVMVLGLLDDLKNLNPFVRLLGHGVVSIIVISSGFRMTIFPSSSLNVIATSCIIVGTINSINLLDGMDGLAAGVSATCCSAFVLVSILQNNPFALLFSLTLLGILLGFLPYNFNPAKIFLGDSGSTLLGLSLAILVISISSQSGSLYYTFGPILILGLPFCDTAYAIMRRIRGGNSIFLGDREHLYDKLMKRGFSQRQTALISYSISIGFVMLGLSLMRYIG
jgi:UDP-GlcNAc:undecaprenyl-phosphate GlcNAc-1-phosphate transferase